MLGYEIYKIVHVVGLLCVFSGLAALWGVSSNGPLQSYPSSRRGLAIIHGVGMTLLLVGGFGMLARLGVAHDGLPGWIIAKLLIWLVLGGSMVLAKRKAYLGTRLIIAWIFLGGLAPTLRFTSRFNRSTYKLVRCRRWANCRARREVARKDPMKFDAIQSPLCDL